MNKKNEVKEAPETIEDEQMNDKKMYNFLVDLYGTHQWKALKRLIDQKMIDAENALCTLDPFKQPTECARSQGVRMGLYSLEASILGELERRKEKKEDNSGVGGYNNF